MEKSFILSAVSILALFSVSIPLANAQEDTVLLQHKFQLNNNKENSKNEVSEVLTFEEITKEIATDFDVSLSEAESMVLQNNIGKSVSNIKAATYRTLSQQFTVTTSYKPTMRFYCETTESGLYHGILKILTVNMIRGYNGITKQFAGTVYVNLERGDRIFYIVNGDFYNNGTTTFNAGVNIGIGEGNSVSFGISNSSNHYAYRYIESYYNW